MPFGPEEAAVYAVFVVGTAVSLFAFFRGRRLKTGAIARQSVRSDPAFTLMADCAPVVGNEVTLDAPSAKALLDLLAVLLDNPVHCSLQSPWAKMGQRAGNIRSQRINDNEIHLSAENMSISTIQIRAEAVGSQIRVRWMIEVTGSRLFITIGQVWALALGLPASVLGPIAVAEYLLGSGNPALRGQTLQVLQVFQVVWEPYLFLIIASQRMNAAGRHLDTIIAQAAYELRTGRQTLDDGPLGARTNVGKM
jgi:hypothetical protein